jgi:anthranilate/para-aminobenzoate synthase component II
MHGKVSTIAHQQTGLFNKLPASFNVTRYHSLVIAPDTLSAEFDIAATCEDGTVIMAIAAPQLKLYGVQFHPESLLTEHGHALLANFLALTGRNPLTGKSP